MSAGRPIGGAANQRAQRARRMSARGIAAAHFAFHASDGAVLDALAAGEHAQSLREYFGTEAYRELSELAQRARHVKPRGGPRILILPGIMGSRLCAARRAQTRAGGSRPRVRKHVLWIDPLRIAAGRLKDLTLPSARPIRPMGVQLFSYAKLKLELKMAGFDAAFCPYDWRRGIDELGAALAARIAARGKPVVLIAHSMGGLIARIACKRAANRHVRRLIMLGTPNLGSFAPVLALRGTYPFVRKLSRLDHLHTPEFLTQNVFSTFPGIYHMLPPPQAGGGGLDLLDPKCWPSDGIAPDAALLEQVIAVRKRLAEPDVRMTHIVGVNRETVVEVRRTAAGFEYGSSRNGDGTVPVALAALPALETYFVEETHGNLANNSRVIRAILDLLRGGGTRALARRFVPARDALNRIDDERLRMIDTRKIDWRDLDSAQREALLADLDGGPEVL